MVYGWILFSSVGVVEPPPVGVAKPTPVADPVDLADPSVDVNDPIPVGVVDPPPMGVG